MKKGLLILIIAVALCVIGTGIILIQGGIAKPFGLYGNVEWYDEPVARSYTYNSKDVTDITLDLVNYEIEVSTYPSDVIKVEYVENYKGEITAAGGNGSISFTQRAEKNIWKLDFTWLNNLLGKPHKQNEKIVISIPENANTFGAVKLSTTNGKINAKNFNAGTAEINALNGALIIDSINASEFSIDTTNGGVLSSNCGADSFNIGTLNGEVRLSGCKAGVTRVSGVNGSIIASDCEFVSQAYDTVNGAIKITGAPGSQNDYTFNIDTVVGSVRINGTSAKSGFVSAGGKYMFSASTVNGSVSMETKS